MKTQRGGFRMLQRLQLLDTGHADPYRARGKLPEAACPDCGAVFRRGRWRWGFTPQGGRKILCPACRRIRERQPAGYVSLGGAFVGRHGAEILKRIAACESAERRDHPLQRIMSLDTRRGGALVTTTDAHLARRIGEALRRAFKGELRFRFSKGENLLRIDWKRDR